MKITLLILCHVGNPDLKLSFVVVSFICIGPQVEISIDLVSASSHAISA